MHNLSSKFFILTALTIILTFQNASAQSQRELSRVAHDFWALSSDVLYISEQEAPRRPNHMERQALQNLRTLERDAEDFAYSLDRHSWRNLQDSYDRAQRTFRDLSAYRWNRHLFDELEDCFYDLENLAYDYFRGGHGGGGNGGQLQTAVVGCHSIFRWYRECPLANVRQIVRADVSRNYSGTQCIQGHNYGFRDNVLWVNNGCRAEFVVHYRR